MMAGESLIKPARIISGGQTGVDRGALDAAMRTHLEAGGWCPAGRRAEDGVIPDIYPLKELESDRYEDRTERNIQESDATLILHRGELAGGTLLTRQLARHKKKPCLVINLNDSDGPDTTSKWLVEVCPRVLNVAGPRESREPGIQRSAEAWMLQLLNRIISCAS